MAVDHKPAWERMTMNTLYMGPSDSPDFIDPHEMYKPDFMKMEERMEQEEPPRANIQRNP